MLAKLAIALVAVASLFFALSGQGASLRPAPAEAYPGADNFQIAGQECVGSGNVRLQMAWTSYNLGAQWFDVSLFNNGWVWGTFVGAGPIASGQNSFTWEGFIPGARHYLRVNTLTEWGWYESQTVSFVTRTCSGGGSGGGSGSKTGPHCDGSTWCSGDPAPAHCSLPAGPGPKGCIWVDRINSKFSYKPGQPVAICYWVDRPVLVKVVMDSSQGTITLLNGPDDGKGDCINGVAGPVGERFTILHLNNQTAVASSVNWGITNP